MKVISAYSIKGGVGKTAAAVNLAYLCALEGARVLVWDLADDGSATECLGLPPAENAGPRKLMFGDAELRDVVVASRFPNLDLVPPDYRTGELDPNLAREGEKPHRALEELLAPLAADYDCVILDCAARIDRLSEAAIYASDVLLVPIVPTTLSVRAFDLLTKYVQDEQRRDRVRDIAFAGFFSMVDRRKQLHNSFVEVLPDERPGIMRCVVPLAAEVKQMTANRAAIHSFAPHSRTAASYETLWREVKTKAGDSWLGAGLAAAAR